MPITVIIGGLMISLGVFIFGFGVYREESKKPLPQLRLIGFLVVAVGALVTVVFVFS